MSQPTPVSIYLDVQHKVENGYDYPLQEAKIDFQRLFHALRSALNENSSLKAQVESANTLIQENSIEMFNKDMELFNMTSQFERLAQK